MSQRISAPIRNDGSAFLVDLQLALLHGAERTHQGPPRERQPMSRWCDLSSAQNATRSICNCSREHYTLSFNSVNDGVRYASAGWRANAGSRKFTVAFASDQLEVRRRPPRIGATGPNPNTLLGASLKSPAQDRWRSRRR